MKKKWWILSLLMLSLMMMGSICVVHAAEEEKTYYCVIKNQNQVVLSNSPKGHVAAWITLSSAASSKAAEGMSYTAQTDQLNITGITAKSMTVYCSNLYIGETACNIGSVISKDTTILKIQNGTHLTSSKLQGIQLADGVTQEKNTYSGRSIEISANNITINGVSPYTYTGDPIKPTVSVKINGKVLELDRDYTVSYADNTNAGNGKIYVKGQGDYKSEEDVEVTFGIKAVSIKDNRDISITVPSCAYNGQPQKPAVTVKFKGRLLKNGTDYTVSYLNNINAGGGKFTITGKEGGNFSGTQTGRFTIASVPMQNAVRTVSNWTYDVKAKSAQPKVTVHYQGAVLKEKSDYTVTYPANTGAGNAVVGITGCGNFAGTVSQTFTIEKAEPVVGFYTSVSKTWYAANDTHGFQAVVKTAGCKGTFKYSSSNSGLLSIEKGGKLKVNKKNTLGKVVITAKFTPNKDIKNYKDTTIRKTVYVVPDKVDVTKGESTKSGQLKITWTQSGKAEAYTIYYCKEKDKKCGAMTQYGKVEAAKGKTTRSKKLTGLAKGNYYVEVAPVCTIAGQKVEGAASTRKRFTVK